MALCQQLLMEGKRLFINLLKSLKGTPRIQTSSQLQKRFQTLKISLIPPRHQKKTQTSTDQLPSYLLFLFSYSVPEEQVLRASKTERLRKKREWERKCPALQKKKERKKNSKSPLKECKTKNRKEQGEPKWPELLLKVEETSQDDYRGRVKISEVRRQEERGETEKTKEQIQKTEQRKSTTKPYTLKYP